MRRFFWAFAALAILLGPTQAADKDAEAKADLDTFKAFLKKNHDGKKWQTGPARCRRPPPPRAPPRRREGRAIHA